MNSKRIAWLCAVLVAMICTGAAHAQRVGGGGGVGGVGGDRGDRGDRVRLPGSIPAIESYAPMVAGVFDVLEVRPSDRVIKLRAKDGKTADVHVQEQVYDLGKLKAGDKVRVDFFQPDEGDTRLRAAGVWPAE
jgi:hypothetical protein